MEVNLRISSSAPFSKSIVLFCKFSGRGPFVLSVTHRVDKDENGALVEWYGQGKTEVLERNVSQSHVVCRWKFSPLEQMILILGFAKVHDNQTAVLSSISTGLMLPHIHICCVSRDADTVCTLLLFALVWSALLLMYQQFRLASIHCPEVPYISYLATVGIHQLCRLINKQAALLVRHPRVQ